MAALMAGKGAEQQQDGSREGRQMTVNSTRSGMSSGAPATVFDTAHSPPQGSRHGPEAHFLSKERKSSSTGRTNTF